MGVILGKSTRLMVRGRGEQLGWDPSSRIYTLCLLIARAPTVLMIYPWRMAFNLEAGELRRHLSSIARLQTSPPSLKRIERFSCVAKLFVKL